MNTLSLGILNQSSVRIEVWYDGTSLRSQIHNARFSPYLCVRRAVQKEESRSRVVLEVLSISHLSSRAAGLQYHIVMMSNPSVMASAFQWVESDPSLYDWQAIRRLQYQRRVVERTRFDVLLET